MDEAKRLHTSVPTSNRRKVAPMIFKPNITKISYNYLFLIHIVKDAS